MSESLNMIYQKMAQANQSALENYPEILCTTGCNQCCKTHGSPITYAVEWQEIKAHWETLEPALKHLIVERYQTLKHTLQNQLRSPKRDVVQALFQAPCPFLVEERCSVYEHRPLTCRAFGLTQHQQPELTLDEALYTCNMEKDRWAELSLPMARPNLPFRDVFFQQLETLDDQPPLSLLKFFDREVQDGTLTD